jgi:tetratricopeptide (TPR) repeat protein
MARRFHAAFDLGVVLENLGRLPEAVGAYEAVVAADPEYADAYFNLPGVYEQLDRRVRPGRRRHGQSDRPG